MALPKCVSETDNLNKGKAPEKTSWVQKQLNQRLLSAVARRDPKGALRWLNLGAKPVHSAQIGDSEYFIEINCLSRAAVENVNFMELAEPFVKAGADPNGSDGKTMLLLLDRKNKDGLLLMKKLGGDICTHLESLAWHLGSCEAEMIDFVNNELGVDIRNLRNNKGDKVVDLAVREAAGSDKRAPNLRKLIETYGGDVNASLSDGLYQPIGQAVGSLNLPGLAYLLVGGADPHANNDAALRIACSRAWREDARSVFFLLGSSPVSYKEREPLLRELLSNALGRGEEADLEIARGLKAIIEWDPARAAKPDFTKPLIKAIPPRQEPLPRAHQ